MVEVIGYEVEIEILLYDFPSVNRLYNFQAELGRLLEMRKMSNSYI